MWFNKFACVCVLTAVTPDCFIGDEPKSSIYTVILYCSIMCTNTTTDGCSFVYGSKVNYFCTCYLLAIRQMFKFFIPEKLINSFSLTFQNTNKLFQVLKEFSLKQILLICDILNVSIDINFKPRIHFKRIYGFVSSILKY